MGEMLRRTVYLSCSGLSIGMHLFATPRGDQQSLDGGATEFNKPAS